MKIETVKEKVAKLVSFGMIPPPVLVYGKPGVGKTTTGTKMAEQNNMNQKLIQCNKWNSQVAKELNDFCMTAPASCNLEHLESTPQVRMVILDEIDQFGSGIDQLRPIMDNFSEKVFFYATTNYPEKLPSAIIDRFLSSEITHEGKSFRQLSLEEKMNAI